MPRPTKRQETATLEITIPTSLHAVLVYLATHTPLGTTENAVAVYLITKEIERMQKAGEYGLRMPIGSQFAGAPSQAPAED
jgi:hypothetical protein